MKVLIRISKYIEHEYSESLKRTLDSLNKEIKNIDFECMDYEFSKEEKMQIEVSRNSFINSKYMELNNKKYNSIIYIPDSSLNLKGNYLWYSLGNPESHVMIISSYLFKELIEGKLSFGDYVLVLYCQFLARFTVELGTPHEVSRNCLNDHCGNQIELLNIFNNEKDVLCDECFSNKIKIKEDYYNLIKNIIGFIKLKKKNDTP